MLNSHVMQVVTAAAEIGEDVLAPVEIDGSELHDAEQHFTLRSLRDLDVSTNGELQRRFASLNASAGNRMLNWSQGKTPSLVTAREVDEDDDFEYEDDDDVGSVGKYYEDSDSDSDKEGSSGDSHDTDLTELGDKDKAIAEKLRMVFELKEAEAFRGEYSCWLIRAVLLKGYIYVTDYHLMFYACLPPEKQGSVRHQGFIMKRSNTSKQYYTYWFQLKGDRLSYYDNSTEHYFPRGAIDLRRTKAVVESKSKKNGFKLITATKKYHFRADTEQQKNEWITVLQTAIFRANNVGDDVRIVIPFSRIAEIDLNKTNVFTEIIRVKVSSDETFGAEEFFFAHFDEPQKVLDQLVNLKNATKTKIRSPMRKLSSMYDTTSSSKLPQRPDSDVVSPAPRRFGKGITESESGQPTPSEQTQQNHNRRPSTNAPSSIETSTTANASSTLSHSPERTPSSIFAQTLAIAANLVLRSTSPTPSTHSSSPNSASLNVPAPISRASSPSTSPRLSPSSSSHQLRHSLSNLPSVTDEQTLPQTDSNQVPPLRIPSPMTDTEGGSAINSSEPGIPLRKKTSWWGGGSSSYTAHSSEGSDAPRSPGHKKTFSEGNASSGIATGFSFPAIRDKSRDEWERKEVLQKIFALPETETVIASFTCYLVKIIPRLGKIYITDNYVCFKSKVVGIQTKVIIPISDVQDVKKEKNVGVFYHGLYLLTKDQCEFFFEFHSADARGRCFDFLLLKVEEGEGLPPTSHEKQLSGEHMSRRVALLEDIHQTDKQFKPSTSEDDLTKLPGVSRAIGDVVSKIPPKPMRVTCLTIGTRGDVQPFIALCKGLQAHGHHCRIATHEEYREWVTGHGIEFRPVKGDPAELMELCVENGIFTLSFIKEGLTRFKDWIDDLLLSAWEACEGTEVLLESPAAMAGIHIAEKLGIPFFGAFTMPFTRTRTYPHPFFVPDRHLGGSYNYMTHVMLEQLFWKGISGQVNRWRKKTLQLPATQLGNVNEHKIPFLYCFSPSVVPPPSDWHDWIHTCGFWFLDNPNPDWKVPQSLIDFINAGPKPVYIGFGSVIVSDPEGLTKTIIQACQKANVRAILSKGWSSRMQSPEKQQEEIEYPDTIYPLKAVPHDWLFPQLAGVVHHGGAGTTAAGIRAGVPTIIRPWFGDQYFWGDRVQELGVGVCLKKLTVDKLASALTEVVTDARIIERARLLGEKIRSEDGVGTAINNIYRDLEFARRRIQKFAQYNNSGMFSAMGTRLYSVRGANLLTSKQSGADSKKQGEVENADAGIVAAIDGTNFGASSSIAEENGKVNAVAPEIRLIPPLSSANSTVGEEVVNSGDPTQSH